MKLFFINPEASFPAGGWPGQTPCRGCACLVSSSILQAPGSPAPGWAQSLRSVKTKPHLFLSFLPIVVIRTQPLSELWKTALGSVRGKCRDEWVVSIFILQSHLKCSQHLLHPFVSMQSRHTEVGPRPLYSPACSEPPGPCRHPGWDNVNTSGK